MPTNLEFITSLEVTTSQEETEIDNIFTSKYNIYKITFADFKTVGSTHDNINLRVIDDGGTLDANGVYDYAVNELRSDTSYSDNKNENFERIDRLMMIDESPDAFNTTLYVYNPQISSTFTFFTWQGAGRFSGASRGFKGIAAHKVAEAVRGIKIFCVNSGRPYDTGKIAVYGVT